MVAAEATPDLQIYQQKPLVPKELPSTQGRTPGCDQSKQLDNNPGALESRGPGYTQDAMEAISVGCFLGLSSVCLGSGFATSLTFL